MAGERNEQYPDWMMGALAQQDGDPVPMGSLASDQDNQASSPLRITVRPKSFQDYLDASPSGQQPADQLIPPPRFGFDDPANPVNQTIGQKAHELLDLGATPRDLLRGDPRYQVTPEVPGQWSERDQYRQDQLNDEVALRGAALGFHATGFGAMGAPFREYGLGAGGGRMVTPPPRGRPNLSEMFAPKPPAAIGIQGVDEAAANISPAMRGLQERGAMLGAQLQSTEEAAGGALKGISDIFKQDMGQALQRDAMVRGRSGRPIQTAPLPIGTEDAILQQGYNRALGLEPSPGPQPPFMQAAARKGPVMGDVAAQNLPMDEISRMARAKEQGYNIDAYKGLFPYHYDSVPSRNWKGDVVGKIPEGGPVELTSIDNPQRPYAGFFSSDPNVASRFATVTTTQGSVIPAKLKFDNPLVIDAKGKPAAAFQFESFAREQGTKADYEAFQNAWKEGKHDGVILKGTADEGTVYIPRYPHQIRSKFARFDPAKISSKDLLAGFTGMLGGGAGGMGELARQNDYQQ